MANRIEVDQAARVIRAESDSVDDLVNLARDHDNLDVFQFEWKLKDLGGLTGREALAMASTGWEAEIPAATELAESVVQTIVKAHDATIRPPVWDVTGAEVDVGAFLSGQPECMIDYPETRTSREGRIIKLVASVAFSFTVSSETLIRRGRTVCALAFALERMGHKMEIWTDESAKGTGRTEWMLRHRVLIKGADDTLDPARIMFALGHPAYARAIAYAAVQAVVRRAGRVEQMGGERAAANARYCPADPEDDGDGGIYLPCVRGTTDVPDAHEFITAKLREIGLIEEGEE